MAKSSSKNANWQPIFAFKDILEFTAGAVKLIDNQAKYVPLFPYFYCKDVQQGLHPQGQSDSESQEENKEGSSNKNKGSVNSLSGLKLDEVAPPNDVEASFFGDRKSDQGSNRYEKI